MTVVTLRLLACWLKNMPMSITLTRLDNINSLSHFLILTQSALAVPLLNVSECSADMLFYTGTVV